MYSAGVLGFLVLITAWLGVLTFLVFQERKFLTRLSPKGSQGDIRDRLKEVLNAITSTRQECQALNKNVREVARDGLRHIQQIALKRYNPYADTGGDQSFSIALLDGRGDGVVLTSLHTRAGTRVYTKAISKGKSEIHLSKEEQQVVETALNSH